MKNEKVKIISKYFSKDENIIRFEPSDNEEETLYNCLKFFDGIISYDAPDMYNRIDNEVLIVEHFEFDASIKSKKGS